MVDVQEKAGAGRNHCEAKRPRSALGTLSPEDFARASTEMVTAVDGKAELVVLI